MLVCDSISQVPGGRYHTDYRRYSVFEHWLLFGYWLENEKMIDDFKKILYPYSWLAIKIYSQHQIKHWYTSKAATTIIAETSAGLQAGKLIALIGANGIWEINLTSNNYGIRNRFLELFQFNGKNIMNRLLDVAQT
jgi:hypothetical protein